MYHPYKDGYSVLPKLNKNTGPIFEVSEDRDWYLSEKHKSVKNQVFYIEHNLPPAVQKAVAEFIKGQYPLEISSSFGELMMQIQEDVIIHMMDDREDWMAAGHVCFPSGWLLEKKIGRGFEQIHAPVPQMNLSTSRKLVEAMIHHGPFERFVWTVVFERKLNGHPSLPRKQFDPQNPEFWIKVERQLTYGLPEHNAALFVLRQYLLPESEVDIPKLVKSLEEMSEEHRVYKGLHESIPELLRYLAG